MEKKSPLADRVVCLLFKSDKIEDIAEACLRFTPKISVRPNEAIFLDIGASLNLFTEDVFFMRLNALLKKFGVFPRLGIADDASTAIAHAQFQQDKKNLPLEALHYYADAFSTNKEIEKRTTQIKTTLETLGLKNIEQFLELTPRSLASRFGQYGIELSMRARGTLTPPWPRFEPKEIIVEEIDLHDSAEIAPCFELEPLLFILRNLVGKIIARLHGRGERASRLSLVFNSREWKIDLPFPQNSTTSLISILREKLSTEFSRKPLSEAVSKIILSITETTPSRGSQRNFFNNQEEEAEAMENFMGRMTEKLGEGSVFRASLVDRHLPEKAWKRSTRHLNQAEDDLLNDLTPARPTRVLKKPQPLQKEGDIVFRENKQWRVMEWHGPERISCEWWRDAQLRGFNRDYYRLTTDSGEELWVFSVPGRPDFYLHGYFD